MTLSARSVFSYSMTSLEVVGVPGVHCSDPWVDLTAPSGQGGYPGHMSCSVTVPDPDLEPGEEPPPELLTVPYSESCVLHHICVLSSLRGACSWWGWQSCSLPTLCTANLCQTMVADVRLAERSVTSMQW